MLVWCARIEARPALEDRGSLDLDPEREARLRQNTRDPFFVGVVVERQSVDSLVRTKEPTDLDAAVPVLPKVDLATWADQPWQVARERDARTCVQQLDPAASNRATRHQSPRRRVEPMRRRS
jgi:hypothetical protein